VDFVGLLGGGRRAVGLGAVRGAGLAAGVLGLDGGGPIGEGGGLALAGSLLLFEQAGQSLDLGFQFDHAPLQGAAAGTRSVVHAGMIVKASPVSCA